MILTKFEAKLDIAYGIPAPDVYDASTGRPPPDDFIVSRNRDGTVASMYGDLIWNISAWRSEGRCATLNFDFWPKEVCSAFRDQLSREARWIMFSLIWLRDGNPLSVDSVRNYCGCISALVIFADEFCSRVSELLADEKRLRMFVYTRCTPSRIKLLCGWLSHFVAIGETLVGFKVVSDKLRREFNLRARQHKSGYKQHSPIPTRIYSNILSVLSQELTEWEQVAPECLVLMRDSGADCCYGRKLDTQKKTAKRMGIALERRPEWDDIAPASIRAYLNKKGVEDNLLGLASMVCEIQRVAKLTIQAFSGMREDEASSLPYDCMDTMELSGRKHRLISGRTTKLSKRIKRVRWVTNKEGHRAIEISQQIASVIYAVCDAEIVTWEKTKVGMNGCPLFVSVSYLALRGERRLRPKDGHFFAGGIKLASRVNRLRERLQPTIEDDDLVELEQIDEHRAWRTERNFQVGRPWVLTSHQLRRSLAMYAQRSGLVTLPSLRRQLQHITEEMSRYYAKGSQYCKDLFGGDTPDKDHFMFDWQFGEVESATISYTLNVLLGDAELFGGHASFVKHRLQGADGVVGAQTRAETVRMFKKGELHYRETLMGGCTRKDECDHPALDWLNAECIRDNCSNLVGNLKKLESVITEQERFVESISPTSLLYRTERANLDVLVHARDKARLENNGGKK